MFYPRPRRSNFGTRILILGVMLLAVVYYIACSANSPQVRIENPSELCAQALAMSSEVRTQAAKLGLEPIELARRTCAAAILAAQVAEANLPKASGIAGATSSSVPPSMAAAGAAGAGGGCTCIGHVPFGDRACTCIGGLAFGGG